LGKFGEGVYRILLLKAPRPPLKVYAEINQAAAKVC